VVERWTPWGKALAIIWRQVTFLLTLGHRTITLGRGAPGEWCAGTEWAE